MVPNDAAFDKMVGKDGEEENDLNGLKVEVQEGENDEGTEEMENEMKDVKVEEANVKSEPNETTTMSEVHTPQETTEEKPSSQSSPSVIPETTRAEAIDSQNEKEEKDGSNKENKETEENVTMSEVPSQEPNLQTSKQEQPQQEEDQNNATIASINNDNRLLSSKNVSKEKVYEGRERKKGLPLVLLRRENVYHTKTSILKISLL